MGFTQADAAEEDDIRLVFYAFQSKQVLYVELIDFFRPRPVKLLKGFDHGETREFYAALDGSACRSETSPSISWLR